MELEVPSITCKGSQVDEYLRLRSASPDPRQLSPQPPPSIDSEMSATSEQHHVRFQPAMARKASTAYDPVTGHKRTEKPHDHMLLSVLALLFCMLFPTIFCAVLAIVYSFQVDVYWHLNKPKESQSYSLSARNWAVATFAFGIAIIAAVIFMSTLWVSANRPNG